MTEDRQTERETEREISRKREREKEGEREKRIEREESIEQAPCSCDGMHWQTTMPDGQLAALPAGRLGWVCVCVCVCVYDRGRDDSSW